MMRAEISELLKVNKSHSPRLNIDQKAKTYLYEEQANENELKVIKQDSKQEMLSLVEDHQAQIELLTNEMNGYNIKYADDIEPPTLPMEDGAWVYFIKVCRSHLAD